MDLCFFPGCNMPANRPDAESAIRLTMPALGVQLHDVPGYVCCPAFGTFPSTDNESHFAASGWNISIVEQLGHDIMVQCGSCYSSLHMGLEHFHADKALRDKVNGLLEPAGRQVNCTTKVRHVTDVLYNDVGPEKIAENVKKKLTGIHGIVQYPCHTLFPSDVVGFEKSPRRPVALRKIVEALGATVDAYSLEYGCCGGAGGFSKTSPDEADAFTKAKLDAILNETKAEFIVVSCITCLIYMDSIQQKLNKKAGKEIYNIPVFDCNQLLALCMGFDGDKVATISKTPRDSILRHF
jgi:heterodisulfide reductase subunit B